MWFDHRASTATTDVTARLDTLDALDLEASVADLAGVLGRLGDDRALDVRRATALGLLAHPQRALDLATGQAADEPTSLNGSKGTLFLHVTTGDLDQDTGGTGGRVEKLGPATLTPLRDWLQRFSGVTVRPVLDLDLDHIIAYVPPDEGGPPGQTNPANLAALCRRHHRVKTFTT